MVEGEGKETLFNKPEAKIIASAITVGATTIAASLDKIAEAIFALVHTMDVKNPTPEK